VNFAADPLFFDEFHHGGEVVAKRQPGFFIEVIDLPAQFQISEASVSQQLPDVGEVLLLDVGLVVLFVGSRTRPFDAALAMQEICFDDFVEELAAVVAIKSEHREGHAFLNALKAATHFAAAVAPQGGELCPAAVEVGEREAPEEGSAAAPAAV
jgi:hypothetical protein